MSDITTTTQDGIIFVRIESPKPEEGFSEKLLEKVEAAADLAPGLPVLLDLSNVQLLPSMSIGTLVSLRKKLLERKQRLILIGAQQPVRNTLSVCRLDKLFEFCATETEARTRLTPQA